jgi:hypothetical protein
MKKTVRLTPALLRKIVSEETKKFGAEKDVKTAVKGTDEVDADEYADSLDKHIDFMKALKVEEGRLTRRLTKIQEVKQRVRRAIAAKI